MASRRNTATDTDEQALVSLATSCHYDQWCVEGIGVFSRGEPPISLPYADAERIVADAAGALVMEDRA